MSTAPLIGMQAELEQIMPAPANRLRTPIGRLWAKCQGGLLYALGDQVVYSFGNMTCAAMLSRHGSHSEFGIYILTQRALDILIQICNVFLWAPFTFHLPKTVKADEPSYEGGVLTMQILFCIAMSGMVWCGASLAGGKHLADVRAALTPLVLPAGFILFREFTRRMYFARMRFQEAFWTELVTVALQVGGMFLALRLGCLSVKTGLAALAVGAAVVSLWWAVREWSSWRFSFRALRSDARRDFALGRWLFGSNMVALAGAQWNPWLLGSVLGSASVGSYAICESVVNIPRVALNSLQNAMGPMVAKAESDGGVSALVRVVRRLNYGLFAVSAVLALAIWALAPWLAHVIFKVVPSDTRLVAGLLGCNLVIFAGTLAQSYGLTALNRADRTVYANGIGVLVQALISLPLVRSMSLAGAALALICGNVTVLLVRNVFWRREIRRA